MATLIEYSKKLSKEVVQITPTMFEVRGHSVKFQIKKGRLLLLCDCSNDTRFCNESPMCSHKLAVLFNLALRKKENKLDNLIKLYKGFKENNLKINIDMIIQDLEDLKRI